MFVFWGIICRCPSRRHNNLTMKAECKRALYSRGKDVLNKYLLTLWQDKKYTNTQNRKCMHMHMKWNDCIDTYILWNEHGRRRMLITVGYSYLKKCMDEWKVGNEHSWYSAWYSSMKWKRFWLYVYHAPKNGILYTVDSQIATMALRIPQLSKRIYFTMIMCI